MSVGFAGQRVVGLGELSIDVFLDVQNERCSYILYQINYIAYGFHLWYKIYIVKERGRTPTSQHTGLATSLHHACTSRQSTSAAPFNVYVIKRSNDPWELTLEYVECF